MSKLLNLERVRSPDFSQALRSAFRRRRFAIAITKPLSCTDFAHFIANTNHDSILRGYFISSLDDVGILGLLLKYE